MDALERKTLAIGALYFSGIAFMGANLNGVQCTVIAVLAVMCTLGDRALDGLIRGTGTTGHNVTSGFDLSSAETTRYPYRCFAAGRKVLGKHLPSVLFSVCTRMKTIHKIE